MLGQLIKLLELRALESHK